MHATKGARGACVGDIKAGFVRMTRNFPKILAPNGNS